MFVIIYIDLLIATDVNNMIIADNKPTIICLYQEAKPSSSLCNSTSREMIDHLIDFLSIYNILLGYAGIISHYKPYYVH